MYIRWFELNILNTTKLLKNQRYVQLFAHIYQLKLIPLTGILYLSAYKANNTVCCLVTQTVKRA